MTRPLVVLIILTIAALALCGAYWFVPVVVWP